MRARTKGMGEKGEVLDENGRIIRRRKTVIEVARILRKPMTQAEGILWNLLKKNARGMKFYAQAPIDRFVVDFYCPREKLIIEIDGDVHAQRDVTENDLLREEVLRTKDLRVLRFKNEEVIRNLYSVYQSILQACHKTKHKHSPSAPQCGRG